MRSALNRLADWIRKNTEFHPSSGDLFAALDHELTEAQDSRVRSHLSRCEKCRRVMEHLQDGLRQFGQVDSTILHEILQSTVDVEMGIEAPAPAPAAAPESNSQPAGKQSSLDRFLSIELAAPKCGRLLSDASPPIPLGAC